MYNFVRLPGGVQSDIQAGAWQDKLCIDFTTYTPTEYVICFRGQIALAQTIGPIPNIQELWLVPAGPAPAAVVRTVHLPMRNSSHCCDAHIWRPGHFAQDHRGTRPCPSAYGGHQGFKWGEKREDDGNGGGEDEDMDEGDDEDKDGERAADFWYSAGSPVYG